MKKVLRVFMLLFAFLVIWGGKVYCQTTTTEFGSGKTKSILKYDESTKIFTFIINNPGDLAACSDSDPWINADKVFGKDSYGKDIKLNGSDLTIETGDGVTLTEADLKKITSLTYNADGNVYDLSKASLPKDLKLSEVLIAYSQKFATLGFVLPLDYEELASEFNASGFVMYSDGTTAKLVSKGKSFAKTANYLGSCTNLSISGSISEDIGYSALASLATLDVSAAEFSNTTSTITVPSTITEVKIPQGVETSRILPEGVKVTVVTPKEEPFVKDGNALTISLDEDASLRDIIDDAEMSFVSNLTIKTVGERKLTQEDIDVINELKFRYTKEIDGDKVALWQDATLNLEGCNIENYDILKSLKNNASTEGEESYTGIRNVILPSGLDKKIVNAEHFVGLENMNAAISVAANQSALVGYVAIPGGLSTTMYQYPTFRPNAYNYGTKTLKSLTLSGSLLPCDFAGTIAGQEKILDEDGHLSYEVDAAGAVTYKGVKSFATDVDPKTTQALLGASLTDIDLEDAVFTNYLDMNFSLLGHSSVVNVKLPTAESMTQIPPLCMDKCTKVEKLVVPGNYETLGAYAFNQMDGMNTLELGIGVKTLGSHCFQNCTSLKQVVLPIGMESVGEYAFVGCKNIKDLNIPYGVKTIEAHAFENLDGLSAVRLPYTLETIGDYAFSDCNYISTITIPENVKTIGDGAFLHTNSLRDIYMLGKTAPEIYDYEVDEKGNVVHHGTFDGMTLNNEYGTFSGTEATHEKYWRNKTEGFPLGKGAAFLHYPKGCGEQYTDETRKESYHAVLVDEKGKKVLDDDGKEIRIPNNQDGVTKEEWPTKYTGWKRFMLSIANQTGDDNSSVWTVRHMYDDTWYTMCFPFDLTINQLISTFGSGFEIAYFCGVEKNATNNTMTLQFTESNYMKNESDYSVVGAKAGVPYMIHPNSGVGNYDTNGHKKTVFVFSGVSPDFEGNPVKGMKGYDYGEGAGSTGPSEDPNNPKFDHSYTFIGSYGDKCEVGQYFVDKHNEYVEEGVNNVLQYQVGNAGNAYKKEMPKDLLVPRAIPEGYYFLGLAKNATFPKFYRESRVISTDMDNSSPDKTYKTGLWTRFTAMVKGVDAEGQAAKKNLGIAIGDYDNKTVITGINIIGANGQQKEYIDLTNKVYNLNGQVVRSDSTDLKGLPAGVYVVKGKKFVVR